MAEELAKEKEKMAEELAKKMAGELAKKMAEELAKKMAEELSLTKKGAIGADDGKK